MKLTQRNIIYLIGICLVAVFFGYQSMKNSLITMQESIDSSWAQVENQLQRRYDLIPNLVTSVKAYAKHEKEIFTSIAESRSKLIGARTRQSKLVASNGMESALSRLLMVAERYPNLKADANFRRLMDELSGTENRLSVERRRFNENVKVYNRTIRKFPYRYVAQNAGFDKQDYFKIKEQAKEAPVVDFN